VTEILEAKATPLQQQLAGASARIQEWVTRQLDDNALDIARLFRASREMLVNRVRGIYESYLADDPTFVRARTTAAGAYLNQAIDDTVDKMTDSLGRQAIDHAARMLNFQPRLLDRHLSRYVGLDFSALPPGTQTALGELTTSVVGGGTFFDRLFNVTDNLKQDLVKNVRAGLLGGETFDQVRDRVQKAFGVDKLDEPTGPAYGSVKVYKNEARRQWNLLMKDIGDKSDTAQVWWATIDERSTPGCVARHGFPIDGDTPPRHFNCRCTVAIFPVDEDLKVEQQRALAWLNAKGYSRKQARLKEGTWTPLKKREALVPGWAWGKTTIQPAAFATMEMELYARYKVIPWRDVARVASLEVESWSDKLTPVLAFDRPDCAVVRAYGVRREVFTWEGWRSVLPSHEGDWIETMTGWALDSATIQPSWDERQQRLPLLLLGYYPALRTVTFPIARAYAMKVVDRPTAEKLSMGLLDPGEALPDAGPRFDALALRVLSVRPSWDPYLAVWTIDEPDLTLRTIVSLATGRVLYSNTPFDGVLTAPYLRVAAAVFEPPRGIWAVIPRGMFDWVLPGGHIDPGERPRDAVVREMREETGIDVVPQMELGRIYRPWSTTIVYLARRVGEQADVATPAEIDAVSMIPFDQLSADERLWLLRHLE